MSEKFTFDVNYSTTFDQLENLRQKMITFLKSERRDFYPSFDVTVAGKSVCLRSQSFGMLMIAAFEDISDQSKMTLRSDIKYKSNWQQAALKGARCFLQASEIS
jgi:hypothetical protein